jgi:hypothetical protein
LNGNPLDMGLVLASLTLFIGLRGRLTRITPTPSWAPQVLSDLMGLLFGPARLDATLSEGLLYHGAYFLTGNESNFVMSLAFLYRFGGKA